MNYRAVAAAVLAGTLTMFSWQAVSNAALPSHTAAMNGVSDRVAPDKSDRASAAVMGPVLAKQAALDLVVVAVLCLFTGFLLERSPLAVAKALALAGGSVLLLQEVSNSIRYGFTIGWAAVNVIDQTIGLFLTGLVIATVLRKIDPDNGVSLPQGEGYRTSGGRRTVAR